MNLPSPKFLAAKKTFTRGRAGLLILCALSLGGCRTAPDMKPFADGTAQLASAIKTSGQTVVAEVDAMSVKWDKDQRAAALATAEKFEQQWGRRNALADALADYSASLAAIASAGEQGEKSALAVADSFKKFTDAIDVAIPQAAAVGEAVKIGAKLYGKFAQAYAARTLGGTMRRLQPAIDETTLVLGGNLQQIETGLDSIRDEIPNNVGSESIDGSKDGVKVRTERNTLKNLSLRRVALVTLLNDGTKARDDLRAELLKAADPDKEKEFARLAALNTDITAELASVEASLQSEAGLLAPFDARKVADQNRLSTEIELVRTVRAGLDDWAAAHARLAAAALEKKPLQVNELIQTANEIQDLVKTVRAGHNP